VELSLIEENGFGLEFEVSPHMGDKIYSRLVRYKDNRCYVASGERAEKCIYEMSGLELCPVVSIEVC
jgi:hypothetical protein